MSTGTPSPVSEATPRTTNNVRLENYDSPSGDRVENYGSPSDARAENYGSPSDVRAETPNRPVTRQMTRQTSPSDVRLETPNRPVTRQMTRQTSRAQRKKARRQRGGNTTKIDPETEAEG